jgi:predicted transglutaminase-like cysteine proteinase
LALVVSAGIAGHAVATPELATADLKTPVYDINNYPFPAAPALMQWRSVLARESDLESQWHGDRCQNGLPRLDCAAREANQLEDRLRKRSPVEQIAAVYSYFNAFRYQEHGHDCGEDCWASRFQFIIKRQGDCGDHALAEYFTLRRLGFEERDLQLVVAQLPGYEDSFRGGHVVLRVFAANHYYILDNRRTDLTGLSGLKKYKVLAGLNASSVQIYNLVTPAPPPGFITDATKIADLLDGPGLPATAPAASAAAAKIELTPEQAAVAAAAADDADLQNVPAEDAADAHASGECVQEARTLADWKSNLPCISTKPRMAAAAKASEQPKVLRVAQTQELVEIAPKMDAAPDIPSAKGCIQDAKLADWNPYAPCTGAAHPSRKAVKVKKKPV